MKLHSRILLLVGLLCMALSACASQGGTAAKAVEDYNRALVAKDANRLSTLSCASWEADAQNELNSLAAVTVSLENMSCQDSGVDGDTTLVSCSGNIVANYGNEVLEINLADRTYQAINQGGEWRMCGYR